MAESADADDPIEPNIGLKCVGCGVGMDAFGSPIGAAAMNPLLIIKLGFRCDLTTKSNDIVFHHGFAGHTRARVLLKAGINNGVGNGVTHLIGMTLSDGLGRENIGLCHVVFTNLDGLIH